MEKKSKSYKSGKIYKIAPICEHDDYEEYYESTTQPLSKRFGKHTSCYRHWKNNMTSKVMVYDLFDKYGAQNCKIYLVEDFPCNKKDELKKREGEIIKANKCINNRIAGRNPKEYYQENKVKRLEANKQYWDKNQDKIREQRRTYRELNKDKIKQIKGQQHLCECGTAYTNQNKARHTRSKIHQRHQQMINQLNELNSMHTAMLERHKQLFN